ncbi:MAG: glycosyltransferase family 4 protein, partial [Clostridia bacterium]|nr:glycosyltransferase family 4 protein [Clostridia bacterium]
VSSAPRPYLKTVLEAEIARSRDDSLKKESSHLWNKRMMRIYKKEIEETQYFLVASNYVKQGLVFCGVSDEQVLIVPYGANVSGECRSEYDLTKPLQIIFVGQVNVRKGIPYLLQAVSELPQNAVELHLVGAYNEQDSFVQQNKDRANIFFEGMVTHDKVKQYYTQADVFVIASLTEGMAQVGLEAMACGLPIICSTNSGVSDLITEGKEGFIVPVGDIPALKEKIEWFIHHRESIPQMSEAAHRIGKQYTWERYNEQVVACVRSIMEAKPE